MSSYTFYNMDYTPMVNLIKNILNGSYVDERFSIKHNKVLNVILDNIDDFHGDRDLFNTFCVGDIYYQSDMSLDDDSVVLRPDTELLDMLYGNIDIEIKKSER